MKLSHKYFMADGLTLKLLLEELLSTEMKLRLTVFLKVDNFNVNLSVMQYQFYDTKKRVTTNHCLLLQEQQKEEIM